jgi:DNA-binding winged helix-turn-helix (wHTH) protein
LQIGLRDRWTMRSVILGPLVGGMNTEVRLRQLAAADPASGEPALAVRYVSFGVFCLDLQRQELFKNGSRVRVPGKVYQVLDTLLERPGEIVTREALRTRLWPADTHVNFEANVNTTVNKLRQVLGDSNEESAFVQTIPRRGYSFIAKVEYADKVPSSNHRASVPEPGHDTAQNADSGSPVGAKLLDPKRANLWFTTGVIALVVAAMLLGAAITLFSHRF